MVGFICDVHQLEYMINRPWYHSSIILVVSKILEISGLMLDGNSIIPLILEHVFPIVAKHRISFTYFLNITNILPAPV
jgi:hypothetical protein